jgi:hypothetical protein
MGCIKSWIFFKRLSEHVYGTCGAPPARATPPSEHHTPWTVRNPSAAWWHPSRGAHLILDIDAELLPRYHALLVGVTVY